MQVVVTGSSGLVGSVLVPHLRAAGHEVRTLVRHAPRSANEARWDPAAGQLDVAVVADADAVVHLAGAGVGDHRWTDAYKDTIMRSRVDSTTLLARTLALAANPSQRLLSASGVDFYQDSPDEVDDTSPTGTGFLAEVSRRWEAAADPARDAGVSVAYLRSGLVLAQRGGVLGRLGPLIRLGLGGPIGAGRQWWSWISLTDHVRAITWLLDSSLTGPVNLTSPGPVQQKDFMRVLGHAAHRPAILPVPAIALRLAIGEFAESVLASHRVRPRALQDNGFTFEHADLASAAEWVLG